MKMLMRATPRAFRRHDLMARHRRHAPLPTEPTLIIAPPGVASRFGEPLSKYGAGGDTTARRRMRQRPGA